MAAFAGLISPQMIPTLLFLLLALAVVWREIRTRQEITAQLAAHERHLRAEDRRAAQGPPRQRPKPLKAPPLPPPRRVPGRRKAPPPRSRRDR